MTLGMGYRYSLDLPGENPNMPLWVCVKCDEANSNLRTLCVFCDEVKENDATEFRNKQGKVKNMGRWGNDY